VRLVAAFVLVVVAACRREPGAQLTFGDEGKPDTSLSMRALLDAIPSEEIRGVDPYYGKAKRFRAWPLRRVLALGFGPGVEDAELIFRATDGYAAYMRGALAVDEGAYLAFEDVDVPGWEPIGPQHASPAPFYVVWKKPEQQNLESHPRPWALARIERTRFEVAYPHTKPAGASAAALRGYETFRDRCFKCHAINREGGRVGPDLNVPRNILEYRPAEQVRAYIRDPATFRFGNMPAHPDFSETQLDELLAYLAAMKDRKHVP